jgi:hypothetical protein
VPPPSGARPRKFFPLIWAMWNSVRRFCSLFAGVSFGAMGFVAPKPTAMRRERVSPFATSQFTTASARAPESFWFIVASPSESVWPSIRRSVTCGLSVRN